MTHFETPAELTKILKEAVSASAPGLCIRVSVGVDVLDEYGRRWGHSKLCNLSPVHDSHFEDDPLYHLIVLSVAHEQILDAAKQLLVDGA